MANKLVLLLLMVSWRTVMALCYLHFVITKSLLVLPVPRMMPRVISARNGVQLPFLVGAHILTWLPLSIHISAHTSNAIHASYNANWDKKPRIMENKLYFTDFSNINVLWKLRIDKLTFFSSFLLILTSGRSEEQQPHWREVRAVYQALWKKKGSSMSWRCSLTPPPPSQPPLPLPHSHI